MHSRPPTSILPIVPVGAVFFVLPSFLSSRSAGLRCSYITSMPDEANREWRRKRRMSWRVGRCNFYSFGLVSLLAATILMPRQRNLWVTDTVEWCREARLGVAGESAAGWWGAGSFAASCLSNQFDIPGKRYAVTSRPSRRACESRTDYCLLDFSGSGAVRFTSNRIGRLAGPYAMRPSRGCHGLSPAYSKLSNRDSRSDSAILASRRASAAPRQKWMPWPNAT